MEKNFIDVNKELEGYEKFAFNRNLMQVAIGLVLMTAFQKAVTGICDFLIMPILNYFIGKTNGNWRTLIVSPIEGMNIELGHLLGTLLDFIILTFVLYLIYTQIIKRIWPSLDDNPIPFPPLPTPTPTPTPPPDNHG